MNKEGAQGSSTPPSSSRAPDAAGGSDALLEPGNVIGGKYRVERLLGRGGIGVVVSARHIELDETFAIKFLQSEALQSPVQVERFVREARLAAKIRSEHVVRVHDVSRLDDGTPYMVMECLEGADLARELETGARFTVERAIDYVLQACEALADAHSIGIVHRDLKPDNLFLARGKGGSSVIKLLDFGISKTLQPSETGGLRRALTLDTDSFGTPAYMSPEQLRASADVDARADIWALGVVLYELLSAELPFRATTVPELCAAVLGERPIPLSAVRPDLPAELSLAIEKCLERDRERRYRNVAELAQELKPFAAVASFRRIEHIVSVIAEGGEHIRPPSLSSPGITLQATVLAREPSSPRVDRFSETVAFVPPDPRTTQIPTSSQTNPAVALRGSRSKVVAIAGALVVGAAVTWLATSARKAPTAVTTTRVESVAAQPGAPSPSATTPAAPQVLAASAAGAPEPPMPPSSGTTAERRPAVLQVAAPEVSAPLPQKASHVPARPHTPLGSPADAKAPPSASPSPPKPAPMDPGAIINAFE